MDIFHMTYVKSTTFHKLKTQQKHPVYEDKSDTRRKVVIVRGTLISDFMFRTLDTRHLYEKNEPILGSSGGWGGGGLR